MLDDSEESKSFNAAPEQVYRSILEYLLLAKAKIISTVDSNRIEATCGKFLAMRAKDTRKNIVVEIGHKADGICDVKIFLDFSKSNIELFFLILAIAIEFVAIGLLIPFVGFHFFIFMAPLVFAIVVYYFEKRSEAFLTDLWSFLNIRLLPSDKLISRKDFIERFPSLDLNEEQVKPFVFEDHWSSRNLYGKNRFGERGDHYQLELEQTPKGQCLVKTRKGSLKQELVNPYKTSKDIKIIEQLHKRKTSPKRIRKIGYYFLLSFACLVSSASLLWKYFDFPPIRLSIPISIYSDLKMSVSLRSENDFITIAILLISFVILLKWKKLADYVRSENSIFFLTVSLFLLFFVGVGSFFTTRYIWMLLMSLGFWILIFTAIIMIVESCSNFQYISERYLTFALVISFPLFFVLFYLLATNELYDISPALALLAFSAIFLCFTGIPSDIQKRDKIHVFLYDADPNSEIYPFIETFDSPHWVSNRFYWVYRVVYRWLWEVGIPPKRDSERVDIWVNANSGKIEWVVSDFHYRELWYRTERELEFLPIWWDESFHTMHPITDRDLVDLYARKRQYHLDKMYREFFREDKDFKVQLKRVRHQYTTKHPARAIGRFFSGFEKVGLAACAELPWSKWRYPYGAYSKSKRRRKYDMRYEGHAAALPEEQIT